MARPPACSARSARSPATPCPVRDAIDEDAPTAEPQRLADDPRSRRCYVPQRATRAFWLNPQDAAGTGPFAGRSAIVVDVEDRFTTMLAHQLRHLGLAVEIVPWSEVTDAQLDEVGLVVCGPGPGDPRDPERPDRSDARGRDPPTRVGPASPRGVPQPSDPRGLARHRPRPARAPAPGSAEVRRRVRGAGVHRLLQHVHGARRTGHDRGRRHRDLGRCRDRRCVRAARTRDSRRSRVTSSRSCRATGCRRSSCSSPTRSPPSTPDLRRRSRRRSGSDDGGAAETTADGGRKREASRRKASRIASGPRAARR